MKRLSWHDLLHSLQFRGTGVILMIALPLSVLLICYSYYAQEIVKKQVAISVMGTITLSMQQIDKQMDNIDLYLINQKLNEPGLTDIQTNTDPGSVIIEEERLMNKYQNDVQQFKAVDALFVYNFTDGDLMSTSPNDFQAMKTYLKSLSETPDSAAPFVKWEIVKIASAYKLVRVMRVDNTLVGACFDVNNMLQPVSSAIDRQASLAAFVSDAGTVTNGSGFLQQHGIKVGKNGAVSVPNESSGQYHLMQSHSDYGSFSLLVVMSNSEILENLPNLSHMMFAFLLIIAGVIVLSFLALKDVFFQPTKNIAAAMGEIRDGNLNTHIACSRIPYEFDVIIKTVNKMLDEIAKLKINVYEEQILKQEAEYKQLKAQTNPHFLVNALNSLNQLSSQGKVAEMQETSGNLFGYYQYILRNNSDFVKMREELAFVHNFIEIEKLRFSDFIVFEEDVPFYLAEEPVPTFFMETFVENSVKHGMIPGSPIKIKLSAELAEHDGKRCLEVKILDSGRGFPENVLQHENQEEQLIDEQGIHIGIWNVTQRLRHLYDGEAKITLCNLEGEYNACVKMILPDPTEL